MDAATEVFNIPELMELILLSLPNDTTHSEIASMRLIYTSQTASHTWHELIRDSTPLRQRLYLGSSMDAAESKVWLERTAFPPARPNPWIPHLLLNQRSWGSAWPFESTYTTSLYEGLNPSRPKFWTFSLELSRAQYSRLPAAGHWRDLLATSPPFTDFWYTRSFYELGSGRAPFVTHIDYNAKVPKTQQKYRVHCETGATLGHIVDAMRELFEKHANARFVMIESLRCFPADVTTALRSADEVPTTKSYMPGSSAERAHGWQRG